MSNVPPQKPQETPLVYFSDRTYALIKALTQVILPALGTAYIGLAQIWHLKWGAEISATIVVITTFLGVVLAISSRNYVKSGTYVDGAIVVTQGRTRDLYSIELNDDPENISEKDGVILEVKMGEPDDE